MTASDRPVFNDRYEIQQRIGRGGMADVFVARDRLLDRPVAIKVLFPEFATDPNFVERFRREAQSAANLNHPNIVGVYDWGRESNTYFMAMEYVNGRTLADILRANGKLNARQAAEIAAEVAAALGFAHRSGVVHRDVKPANILIANDGRVKVADFGIARALNSAHEQDLTQAGAVMGTATYFSPEQAQGAQPDPRSDLYSLGIVLYEMVGGRPPFAGDNPVAIAYKQVHDTPQPLNQLAPDVPRPFEAIVAKLLAKNASVRYATAEELRDDLRRFRDGQPVQALTALMGGAAAAAAAAAGVTTAVPSTTVTPRTTATATAAYSSTTAMPRTTAVPSGGYPSQQQPVYEPPRRTGLYVLGSILAIVALVLGGILLFNYLTSENEPTTITMPELRNLTLEDAIAELDSRDLKYEAIPEAKEGVGENVVWDQLPLPTVIVTTDQIITIKFNPGVEPIALVDVVGKTYDEAFQLLSTDGFVPQRVDQDDPEGRPAGTVIGQVPGAGTQLKPGETVQVIVSKGKGQEVVPVLQNKSEAAAKSELEALGFVVERAEEFNDLIPAGQVIGTDPAAGQSADKGSTVKLIVSKGAELVDVPPLIGVTENLARQALQDRELKARVQTVTVAFDDDSAGKVVAQTPSSGQVPKGSTVTITVAVAGPAPATTTTTTTSTTTTTTTTPPSTTSTPTTTTGP
ncbi:MAG: Stk1 family PASTA domain-containing Ser/Thr kinase [Acidimicrobiia bacterium]